MIYRNSWNQLLYMSYGEKVFCKRDGEPSWRISNHDLAWFNARKGTDRLTPIHINLENK